MPKLNLLNELKHIGKTRSIKGYNNMSKERLLSVLSESESAKSFYNSKIEKIKEGFNKLRDKFLKPKMKMYLSGKNLTCFIQNVVQNLMKLS